MGVGSSGIDLGWIRSFWAHRRRYRRNQQTMNAIRMRPPTAPPTAPAIRGVLLDFVGVEVEVEVKDGEVASPVAVGMNLVAVLDVGV